MHQTFLDRRLLVELYLDLQDRAFRLLEERQEAVLRQMRMYRQLACHQQGQAGDHGW
jgi:hypothetical protein